MNRYIQNLIQQGEHQRLDFKFEVSDAPKLARTFSAFANTEGGKLLIGVKDNGTIAGIRTDEEAYMLESAAHVFCKPKVDYTLKSWTIEGKTILEVDVSESDSKPHLAPWKDNEWKAFIRLKDEIFVANSVQVEVWRNQHSSRPTLVKYNQEEASLLDYLSEHEGISLNSFRRLTGIKYPLAKKILANLCTIGVIQLHYSKEGVSYRLNTDYNISE
ncbi:MAG: ATP-binding protein [Bacteroidales bacterium]|nr:ATP-binding protein [Bacteroidales bacterium]